MSKLTIVATRTHNKREVYPHEKPERKIQGGDFVQDENGRINGVIEDGQKLRFARIGWENWEAFVNDNEWVRDELEALEQAEWVEYQDLQDALHDASYRGQW